MEEVSATTKAARSGWRTAKECSLQKQIMLLLGCLLLFHLPLDDAASPISCFSDNGKPTDWFYLYKLPHLSHQQHSDGLTYLLMDTGSDQWADGAVLVNDSVGALGRTVGQLYEERGGDDIAYILYNDQKPEGKGLFEHEKGHTKGVVLLDKTQGFWLVHSTPHFPNAKEAGQFEYPETGMKNGQNFICVTYPLDMFETIGQQLAINEPLIYDCNVPSSLASVLPSMVELCSRSQSAKGNATITLSQISSNRSVSLTSLAGTEFISFAKSASFEHDLYHSWVAPTLKSNLLVQFWRLSTGVLPSDCSEGWKVFNAKTLSPGTVEEYSSNKDHSKWAVTMEDDSRNWICVGDINRNEAEEKRGGGTVCQNNAVVWKAYRAALVDYYPCDD
ncbi:deoxyribonuclease-2-alpha isoform X1 [Paramormyrops kingsleyae]|uniref:deoxyribonuclease-2-alpha isoform X1 n=1 Tax=Paramormyrops kingsleyae TaxID=1676925 RepID=UPI003B976546